MNSSVSGCNVLEPIASKSRKKAMDMKEGRWRKAVEVGGF